MTERQPGSDPIGELQRWLVRSGARSVTRGLGDQVRTALGGSTQGQGDVWENATADHEAPECQWCPICRARRRLRDSGPGLSSAVAAAGDAVSVVLQDAAAAFEAAVAAADGRPGPGTTPRPRGGMGRGDRRAAPPRPGFCQTRPPGRTKPGSHSPADPWAQAADQGGPPSRARGDGRTGPRSSTPPSRGAKPHLTLTAPGRAARMVCQTTAPSSGPESRGGLSPILTTRVAKPPTNAATARNAAQPDRPAHHGGQQQVAGTAEQRDPGSLGHRVERRQRGRHRRDEFPVIRRPWRHRTGRADDPRPASWGGTGGGGVFVAAGGAGSRRGGTADRRAGSGGSGGPSAPGASRCSGAGAGAGRPPGSRGAAEAGAEVQRRVRVVAQVEGQRGIGVRASVRQRPGQPRAGQVPLGHGSGPPSASGSAS